ncbi:fMet-Leu-Phe receptor-like isoform 2-T8 [Clarias gariepinus]|nr:formyl peptide receptor 2-like isoform X2 [Clarias gariepinus]XP_053345738.1 formyl peptide receptor 2-like isoform X2 [Clarias gariepinus]XP_053345739.1 formyl peptide receptor 2-like isoform X2 [Clarias gariepinus]XP_053345740.1 formyl peptide receptor 2-like isoform X2 [Clarias gariepinus]XP_053345741.1 formyl peptide receptor 2-like isoform X2 [Clarias gariepinus]XP_053345742.1 formyl peptide receptor 2-like isoform X2 [Clarias gariepinus]
MASNNSVNLLSGSEFSSKNDKATLDIDAIMENITIVFYTITILFGTTGNAVVIWMSGFRLKANVTNVWLVNLAVADLIFCLTRVTSLIKKVFYEYWPFGTFVCKFNGFFKYTNMFCSVFLLAVISLDRALCVWKPVFTRRRRTLCAARLISVGVWIVAIVFSVPYYVYRQVYISKKNVTKCSMEVPQLTEDDNRAKLALYSIRFLCGFLLPFLIILTCYVLAGLGIRRTRILHKSKPLKILFGLVCAFFLCWGPYHFFLLAKMVEGKSQAVKVGLPIAKCVAYFNSCVNPLLYFCMGLDKRLRFKQSLSRVYARALAEDWEGQSKEQTGSGTVDDSGSAFPGK